jgi:hypothetical protein
MKERPQMRAETTTVSLDTIDAALAAAGSLDADEQRLAATVLRLLSAGKPVSIEVAAAAQRCPFPRRSRCCDPGPRCSGTTVAG